MHAHAGELGVLPLGRDGFQARFLGDAGIFQRLHQSGYGRIGVHFAGLRGPSD